jgi:hypothetical protein
MTTNSGCRLKRMIDNKIKIQFRSKAPDENLTLEEFSKQVTDFNAAFAGLDQFISSKNKSTVAFRVVDLAHSSPASITLESVGLEDSLEDNSSRIIPKFIRTIEGLNSGKKFETFPRSVLEPLYRIAKSIASGLKEIKITSASGSVLVTSQIEKLLADLLETEKITIGTVRGTLDLINVHKGANSFRIYPVIGPSFITCNFPSELKEKAKGAIERYIAVNGTLHYRFGCEHPHLIEADQIDYMPDESTLPPLASFRGIMRLEKSTEETLEEERNGQWQ